MKNSKTVFLLLSVILTSILFITCQKESNAPIAIDSDVTFAVNISHPISAVTMKRAVAYDLVDADRIIITIQNIDGSATKYTSSEVKIQQMNGSYYTQKIVLKTGNYKLTEFLILNANDSTIFAAPLVGSQEAQNVSSPLPIAFTVTKNATTPVNVEVLSTESKKPEDFGLNSFPIIEVKTFGFMVGVTDKENNKLLSAKLTVSNGVYSYVQNLDSILNNVVTVKDNLTNYTLTVEKSGYKTYMHTYPLDSMKMFKNEVGNLPLVIELEKEETVTDIDGNVYHTVKIGTQVWLKENLKTIHYRNGDPIPMISDYNTWQGLSTGAYCNYNNDTTNSTIYGCLYNYYSVVDSRNICPIGWHVPSFAEWSKLTSYLGGTNVAGGKMKEVGSTHWINNIGATNESGFSALPAGYRPTGPGGGAFITLGIESAWWCSSEVWYLCIYNYSTVTNGGSNIYQTFGFSVRCVKD